MREGSAAAGAGRGRRARVAYALKGGSGMGKMGGASAWWEGEQHGGEGNGRTQASKRIRLAYGEGVDDFTDRINRDQHIRDNRR